MAQSNKGQAAKSHPPELLSVIGLGRQASLTLWTNRKLFSGILLIYGLLYALLVQGLKTGISVANLRDQATSKVAGSFDAYGQLLSNSSSNEAAGAYQVILFIFVSLALIWTLRQIQVKVAIRIRDAYYKGMYPIVPFILVLLVIGVQLLPLLIGSSIYQTVLVNNIAVTTLEKLLWGIGTALLGLLSLYFIASSLFALYIVTLPDMTPIKALRSARTLVRNRRWLVLRKIVFLPVVLVLGIALVMISVIIIVPVIAQWVLLLLGVVALAFSHAYMYTLYRGLLNE